jgi:uncharacterized protein (TIGR02118 family)
MVGQLKKIAFLTPRDGLSREEFTRYWREIHGPLVAGSPGYGAFRQKYVQNHLVEQPVSHDFNYSGMAEFWLPGDNEDMFALTQIYRERIKIDEMRFINMDATVSMTAAEEAIKVGSGLFKLVVIHWQSGSSQSSCEQLYDGASRIVRNRVIMNSFRLPGARPIQGMITNVDEYWFDFEKDAQRALLYVDEPWQSAFLVREYVFFDHGRPTSIGQRKSGNTVRYTCR